MGGRHPSGGSTSAQLSKGYLTLPAKKERIFYLFQKYTETCCPDMGKNLNFVSSLFYIYGLRGRKKEKYTNLKCIEVYLLLYGLFLIKLLGHVLSCIIL